MLDVRDFGAVGYGTTDDRPAIQAAIDAASAQGRGGIRIPAGTYRVSRTGVAGGRWSLDLRGVSGFTVVGDGLGSVVQLADSHTPTGDWHVFVLRDGARGVLFTDLVIDGNRTALAEPDEQSHGIEVEPGTEDLMIDRCVVRECFGDGVRLLGSPGANVRRVRLQSSLLQRNKRSGLAIQRAVEDVVVTASIFHDTITDQSIDFEPTVADGPSDLIVQGCLVIHTTRKRRSRSAASAVAIGPCESNSPT
jgi:hypothetical protein